MAFIGASQPRRRVRLTGAETYSYQKYQDPAVVGLRDSVVEKMIALNGDHIDDRIGAFSLKLGELVVPHSPVTPERISALMADMLNSTDRLIASGKYDARDISEIVSSLWWLNTKAHISVAERALELLKIDDIDHRFMLKVWASMRCIAHANTQTIALDFSMTMYSEQVLRLRRMNRDAPELGGDAVLDLVYDIVLNSRDLMRTLHKYGADENVIAEETCSLASSLMASKKLPRAAISKVLSLVVEELGNEWKAIGRNPAGVASFVWRFKKAMLSNDTILDMSLAEESGEALAKIVHRVSASASKEVAKNTDIKDVSRKG